MPRQDWTRDELILALDLYFEDPAARGSKTHPGVIELSGMLNRLPLHPKGEREGFFRNPNGVGMKLSNFLRFDPEYEGKGLARGNRLEEEVWAEFAHDRPRLRGVANAIKTTVDEEPNLGVEDSGEHEGKEGKILTRLHRVRERDTRLVRRKKASVLKTQGALKGEICAFDFAETYGELGEGFAECHHIVPLSELGPGTKMRLRDLAILCVLKHLFPCSPSSRHLSQTTRFQPYETPVWYRI